DIVCVCVRVRVRVRVCVCVRVCVSSPSLLLHRQSKGPLCLHDFRLVAVLGRGHFGKVQAPPFSSSLPPTHTHTHTHTHAHTHVHTDKHTHAQTHTHTH